MTAMLTIIGKQLGSKRTLFLDRQIPYPPWLQQQGGATTLRHLLSRVASEEVAAFNQRQESRRLFRVLTERQIAAGTMQGKIDPAGQGAVAPVAEATAVAAVLQAFNDGLYFVFIEGVQATALDQVVTINPDSTVAFVRLVALAGG